MKEYKNLMGKYIGQLTDKRTIFYDIKVGYVIQGNKPYLRNPTHKELRQIKAKYGNLEKKLK